LKTAIDRTARDVDGAQIVQVQIKGRGKATKPELDDP
jgi:hypothetical protein